MSNQFTERMQNNSDKELIKVIVLPGYVDEAIEAAKIEIKKRNFSKEYLQQVTDEILHEDVVEKQKSDSFVDGVVLFFANLFSPSLNVLEKNDSHHEEQKPTNVYDRFLHYILKPSSIINGIATAIIIRLLLDSALIDTLTYCYREQNWLWGIRTILFSAFQLYVAMALFRKQRIGWALLNIILTISICDIISYYLYITFITKYDLNMYTGWQEVKMIVLYLIFPTIILVKIHAKKTIMLFELKRSYILKVIIISSIIGIAYSINAINSINKMLEYYNYE